jgi:hypothetical protein
MLTSTSMNLKTILWVIVCIIGYSIGLAVASYLGIFEFGLLVPVALIAVVYIFSLANKKPGTLLLIYLRVLPVYTLFLALIYNFTGSQSIVKILQPWKEIFALLFLFFSLVNLVVFRKNWFKRLHRIDILVILYMVLNLVYLIVPFGPALNVRLYGLRANTFFLILYLLGRIVPLSPRQQTTIPKILVGIGFLAGLLTLSEFSFLPKNWLISAGMMKYLRDFFNMKSAGHYGLTWTFETFTGMRRYSGFFANPLELASSTLVTGAAALYLFFKSKPSTWNRYFYAFAYALISLSLILSFSRSSMFAFLLQIIAISVLLKNPRLRLLVFVAISIGVLVILISPFTQQIVFMVKMSLSFSEESSRGHLLEWIEGTKAFLQMPFGLGLGMSGHIGNRFNLKTGGENQFVVIGVDTGIPGVLLYGSIFLFSIYYAIQAFYKIKPGPARALIFIAATSKFAMLLPAFTSSIEIYAFISYVTWWLMGFSIQQLTIHEQSQNANRN